MEDNVIIEPKNDFIGQINKRKFQKNSNKNNNCISFILKFILFILYSIFIIKLSFYIFKKKGINSSRIKKYSLIEKLKLLTYNDKSEYEGAKNCLENNPDKQLCIYQFLCPKEVKGKKRILLGNRYDGSYVIINDFKNIKIAYSIGISHKIQFDKALADRGIDVYMYDHTIKKLPYENMKFHWKKIGIGGKEQKNSFIQTLEDMMEENGHLKENNMILKMDIEGNEWKPLNELSENILNQFKYILIEYHFGKIEPKIVYNVLKKINKTHQSFYVHCCPYADIIIFGNNRLCRIIEVSYIIRKGNIFSKDHSIYPIREFSYANKFNVNVLKLFDDYGKY